MTYSFDIDIAEKYGTEEAIIFQNIQFWCNKNQANNTNIFEGKAWIYNTLNAWRELFPFWSKDKVFRILKRMEEKGMIIKGFHGKNPFDRTGYYTSNIDIADSQNAYCNSAKSDIADSQNVHIADSQNDIKEQINTTDIETVKEYIPYSEIVDHLNQIVKTKYKDVSSPTRTLIKARWNEGYTLDNFKTVIRKKYDEWGSNAEMSKYLRPSTLFGTKFESYLNQPEIKNHDKVDQYNQGGVNDFI